MTNEKRPSPSLSSKGFIAVAKSFIRFEVALCRHSGVRRNPVFSIPRHAGLDPGFRRGDGSRVRHYFWQLLYMVCLHGLSLKSLEPSMGYPESFEIAWGKGHFTAPAKQSDFYNFSS